RQHTLDTHQLNIANGSFHAGRPITGDAGADDRMLLVYRLGGPTRRSLISATVRHAVLGARRTMKEPAFLAVSELWLHTDPPLPRRCPSTSPAGSALPPPPGSPWRPKRCASWSPPASTTPDRPCRLTAATSARGGGGPVRSARCVTRGQAGNAAQHGEAVA